LVQNRTFTTSVKDDLEQELCVTGRGSEEEVGKEKNEAKGQIEWLAQSVAKEQIEPDGVQISQIASMSSSKRPRGFE
jgi:hypothetical protein